MFHTIYKIMVFLIIPIMCVLIDYFIYRKGNDSSSKFDIICKWFVFWSLGISAVTAGLMQMFNPAYTANLLSISTNDFIVIKELGYANFSIGLIAVISLKYEKFRQPAAISYGVFMLLCMLNHMTRLNVISLDEIVSTAADLLVVVVAVLVIVNSFRKRVCD